MWDHVADVVIVGFGSAAAATAITAHDAGAKVLILEKTSESGGNSRYSGGSLREWLDVEQAVTYVETVTYGTVDREMIRAFVQESSREPQWIESLGGELDHFAREDVYPPSGYPPAPNVVFPHLAGAEGIGGRFFIRGEGLAGGARLMSLLHRNVVSRGIDVRYLTPVIHLVTNDNKEVIGVIADSSGTQMRIKARRAVVLACGGFENHPEMQKNYLGRSYPPFGHVGNTGDGIRMAQEIGADLWHMNAVSGTIGYLLPDYEPPVVFSIPSPGYIFVDQHGHRFMDETGSDLHQMAFAFSYFDTKAFAYPRIPAYVIFDRTTLQSGPIGNTERGRISDYYSWSPRNTAEVEQGWIKSGKTFAELAVDIGLDSRALQETTAHYNLACMSGFDSEFGRRQDTMMPLVSPPYYGIAVWPCLFNTQGGPRRNANAQVIHVSGDPIRRMYSAGELGSLWGFINPGAGPISECLAFGRIAGRNAAAEEPWE